MPNSCSNNNIETKYGRQQKTTTNEALGAD